VATAEHPRADAQQVTMKVRDMTDFSFVAHIFKEGETFVAHALKLDVSSCGDTEDEARRNIREAVKAYLEALERMGTAREVLKESGYRLENDRWYEPEFVALDRLTTSL
jgi:predicted RNase H-like HicB family nuclease